MANTLDLTAEAQRLTKALGGVWHGSTGMARCPAHADRKPSLSIAAGRTTVLLHCFAGCDFLEIIRATRAVGALRGGNLPSVADAQEVQAKDYAPLARKVWSESRNLPGTLAERYLTSRGLVGPWGDLRFHPRTPIGGGALATYRPALIAAVRDDSGLVAIHRIALDPATGCKAIDLENPKLTLGKPKRGAVRLFKAGRTLGIAEGIETAISAAAMLTPHTLRHSTAMDLLHHGVDPAVIALWLGHENVETTQIYIHADMRMTNDLQFRQMAGAEQPAEPPETASGSRRPRPEQT